MTTTPRTVKRNRPQGGWPEEPHYTHTVSEANEVEEEKRGKRFRMAMALNDEHFHFTKDERYELARMIVGVDQETGGSWKELNSRQLHDLITMMEGFAYINYMLSSRVSQEED